PADLGGVCTLIDTSCCMYINQNQKVSVNLQNIWVQTKTLYQNDTPWAFRELWEALTSWLPNLAWLRQLFMATIIIIISGVVVYTSVGCFKCVYARTGDRYVKWKRHRLRWKIESGKYSQEP
ncbi:ERVV2 protein, partial [Neodrepanis coruscans]|nr:ERVV2 protein [Neodrepanis coruscans]